MLVAIHSHEFWKTPGDSTVSHEAIEECSSESVAVLDREPLTGFEDNDSSVASAVRTRRRPKRLKEFAAEADRQPGVARRFRDRFPSGVSWGVSAWMLVMHVGAIAAFWYFSWGGLALLAGLHFVTACLGITLGYHRLLTHGSLIVPRPVKYFFSMCGMLSAEGSPLMWVA